VKKELWLFLAKLAGCLLAFGLIRFWYVQELYPYFLKPVAVPFFQIVGVGKWRLSLLLDHFSNMVPYLALVCASPGFFKNWKRTIIAAVGGLLLLMLGHLLLSWLDFYFWSQYKMTKKFFRSTFPFLMLNDALPLGLWLLFYPELLTKLFGFVRFKSSKDTAS